MEPEAGSNTGSKEVFRRIRIGHISVDERRQSVQREGKSTTLTDLSWRFLITLINQAPAPASVEILSQQVWQNTNVSAETIAQRARQLRQALGDEPKSPRYIRTIRGGGYQLIPAVQVLKGDADRARPASSRRRFVYLALGIVLLAGFFGAIQFTTPSQNPGIPSTTPAVDELVQRATEYRRRGVRAANDIAIDLYRQALQLEPDHPFGLVGLSLALSHKPSKYDFDPASAVEAAALADRALLLYPQMANAWAARGLADDARGRVGSALDYYQRARSLHPKDGYPLSAIAYLKQIQGHLHQSLVLEAQALSEGPPSYFADFQIATTLNLAGLEAASDAWLSRAVQLRPDNVFLAAYQARQLLIAGRAQEALEHLNQANNRRVSNDFLRGLALEQLAKADLAQDAFKQGQDRARQGGIDCLPCVAMLISAGHPGYLTAAGELLKLPAEAAQSGDQWPQYRIELAMLAAALGQTQMAAEHLQDAFDLGYMDTLWLSQLPPIRALLEERPQDPRLGQRLAEIASHQDHQRRLIESDRSLSTLLGVAPLLQ